MAKKSKGSKFNQSVPTFSPDKASQDQFQLDDDSRTVRNYLDLKKDSTRHEKAIDNIRSQTDGLDDLTGRKSVMPRKTRSLGRRYGGRRSGR